MKDQCRGRGSNPKRRLKCLRFFAASVAPCGAVWRELAPRGPIACGGWQEATCCQRAPDARRAFRQPAAPSRALSPSRPTGDSAGAHTGRQTAIAARTGALSQVIELATTAQLPLHPVQRIVHRLNDRGDVDIGAGGLEESVGWARPTATIGSKWAPPPPADMKYSRVGGARTGG